MNRSETNAAETVIEEFERGGSADARTSDPVTGTGTATTSLPTDALFTALYHELHRMAERQLRGGGAHSMGATTLLHEVYLDLANRGGARFPDRGRFMAYAARAMRGVVIDYARRARAQKRGGGVHDITLSAADRLVPVDQRPDPDVLEALSEALDELARVDPSLAQLVDLHFFCGFSLQEIAAARGVSERTAQRDWRKARLLLHRLLDANAAASRTLEDRPPHARS